jgi:hypothetical protein
MVLSIGGLTISGSYRSGLIDGFFLTVSCSTTEFGQPTSTVRLPLPLQGRGRE